MERARRSENPVIRAVTRRDFLKRGGLGALTVAAGGALAKVALADTQAAAAPSAARAAGVSAAAAVNQMRLVATDGFARLPARTDDLYIFGFVEAPLADSIAKVTQDFKGKVQMSSPIIALKKDDELRLTLTNVGLIARPDLDDSHTVHWHGFRKPIALFDGVPEVSIAVPPNRDFTYVYRPHDEGTYMYHCHFEDSEHVQMGMDGIVLVRPLQDGTSIDGFDRFAYDDGDGSTGYQREFALLLNEIWTLPHDNLIRIQESVWSDYDPDYWVINGRAYPDTVALNNDPALPSQPISSLMQVNPGERVLMRLVNLGFEQHSMVLPGIRMKVVGEDATLLRGPAPGNADLSYMTNTIYIGPGEARDVLFTAPDFVPGAPGGSDTINGTPRDYNRYLFKNRSYQKLTNGGAAGLGGMVTEVRVYDGSPLGAQTQPSETYGP